MGVAKDLDEDRKEDLGSLADNSSAAKVTKEDPAGESADDLTALLSRAALNQSQYREFSSQSKAGSPPKATRPTPGHSEPPKGNEPDGAGKVNSRRTVREGLRTGPEARAEIKTRNSRPELGFRTSGPEAFEGRGNRSDDDSDDRVSPANRLQNAGVRSGRRNFDSTLESRWSILGKALSGETESSQGRLVQALANSVSLPFVSVSSVSGGTGVTTILATLARCLAAQGERVLLVDAGAVSLFPLYFGAAKPGSGELQNFYLTGSDGHVNTVNRKQPDGSASVSSRFTGGPESGDLVSTICSAAESSDRLLLDARALRASDAETLQPSKQFALVPLVPDLSCVFGLLKLEEAFRQRGIKPEESGTVMYVLNKFDGSLVLHRDIKGSLEQQLGDRLLPVTIRRSDAISEALADGMTVIDYCPDAGVAEDFLRLADWLSERAPLAQRDRKE
jgi:cellulose synthase operon protein YhjQ